MSAHNQPAATPPTVVCTSSQDTGTVGPSGAGGSAADPIDDLMQQLYNAARPLVIYESTDGNTTRKVLAEDALALQRLVRASHTALQRLRVENAALRDERKDWARTFMLDGRTPWEWENLCKRSEAERDTLAAIVRELVDMADVRNARWGKPLRGSPNHEHAVPGIWDSDNGERAGNQCAECAAWDAARAARARTDCAAAIRGIEP